MQGFSIKICNSKCEEPQTCPHGPGTHTEEITHIKRPPRAQEPQGNHCRDYRNPAREEQGRVTGEPPSSHRAEAPGSCSPQAPPAAVYARADPAMDPETRDPGTYYSPRRGPKRPRGLGPSKQPSGVSQHTPKHPALDTESHKYTSGQRHKPPAGSVAGRE
ncbi:hypothetical protein ATANTOWER_003106 [Ataeniobius toweri]|uniref:Uncharacterized protein n=1 Tax=Ataeniobius toweri TaxID=208326 RepID=A0ABU7C611_9TELE|nr:hypothetical protein [Ataeniobius toweri]